MNVWLLRFIVFFVALLAVWQLAAVVVWVWEKVRRKRPEKRVASAVEKGVDMLAREVEMRPESDQKAASRQ